jgi:hypothetical protein
MTRGHSITNTGHADPQFKDIDQAQKYAAYKRALDHYLSPAPSPHFVEPMLFAVDAETSFESALVHTSSLLRCAAATAQEAGDRLEGTSQWRAGLSCVGLRSGPNKVTSIFQEDRGGWFQGCFAAQRGASPLSTKRSGSANVFGG